MHKKHKYRIQNLPNKRELTKVKKKIKKLKKVYLTRINRYVGCKRQHG